MPISYLELNHERMPQVSEKKKFKTSVDDIRRLSLKAYSPSVAHEFYTDFELHIYKHYRFILTNQICTLTT